MDINDFVSKKIKYYRQLRNMTQLEVAEYLNISQQNIAKYENNKLTIKHDMLFKLADLFKIKIDDFFPPNNFSLKGEKEILKDLLIRKGFLKENEEIDEIQFDTLIEFAKANKNFIMKKDNE